MSLANAKFVLVKGDQATPRAPTQLQRTRALTRAFAAQDKAEAALRAARAHVDAAFQPWSAGRSINRDEAREQLESTGFLAERP